MKFISELYLLKYFLIISSVLLTIIIQFSITLTNAAAVVANNPEEIFNNDKQNNMLTKLINNNNNNNRRLVSVSSAKQISYPKNNNDLLNDEFDDTIYDDIEAIRMLISETFYDISASLSKLAADASYTITIFWQDTREFLNSAKQNMNSVISIIAAKIIELTDDAVRSLFENIKKQLQKIEIIFHELSDMADNEFENVMNHLNTSLINISEDMEEWSRNLKIKLRSVKNDETYKEGCKLIDNFISSSINEMYECCNIVIRPVKTVCHRFKRIIENALELAVDVIDRIEKCVLDRRIPPHIMMNCLNDGYDKINDLLAEGLALKHNIMDTLPLKIVISNFCISFATISVEMRKNDVANEVDTKYLKKYYRK